MKFHTRKWVKPEDLNANGTLFGGKLLAWIDEESALYSIVQLENPKVVTKFMSEINFMSAAKQGDIVEIGLEVSKFGKSSLVLKCEVRNMMTRETIITIENIKITRTLSIISNPECYKSKAFEFFYNELCILKKIVGK